MHDRLVDSRRAAAIWCVAACRDIQRLTSDPTRSAERPDERAARLRRIWSIADACHDLPGALGARSDTGSVTWTWGVADAERRRWFDDALVAADARWRAPPSDDRDRAGPWRAVVTTAGPAAIAWRDTRGAADRITRAVEGRSRRDRRAVCVAHGGRGFLEIRAAAWLDSAELVTIRAPWLPLDAPVDDLMRAIATASGQHFRRVTGVRLR